MKKINSIEDALLLFEENTIKRGEALSADDFKTYNKQFSQGDHGVGSNDHERIHKGITGSVLMIILKNESTFIWLNIIRK